jgi:hypothetical protein
MSEGQATGAPGKKVITVFFGRRVLERSVGGSFEIK